MILQSLARYYDILVADPKTNIAPRNFSAANVSYAIVLSTGGELMGLLVALRAGTPWQEDGRKARTDARTRTSETFVRREAPTSSATTARMSWVSQIGMKPSRTYSRERFQAFRAHNLALLARAESVPARAICGFLENYDPAQAHSHPEIRRHLETLLKGGTSCLSSTDPSLTRTSKSGPSGKRTRIRKRRSTLNVWSPARRRPLSGSMPV